MKKYDLIMFDMDGTLIDPKAGMSKSIQYALSQFDIIENDLSKIERFIGSPQKESYMKYYAFTEEQALKAVDFYRSYYKEFGIKQNKVYAGVKKLLESLKKKKMTLAIATLKPTPIADAIARHFELDKYFDLVVGSNPDGTRHSKTEIIAHILKNKNHPDKDTAVMIGDRKYDMIGAAENSVISIGAGYGYGAPGELERFSPARIVNSISELEKALLI